MKTLLIDGNLAIEPETMFEKQWLNEKTQGVKFSAVLVESKSAFVLTPAKDPVRNEVKDEKR